MEMREIRSTGAEACVSRPDFPRQSFRKNQECHCALFRCMSRKIKGVRMQCGGSAGAKDE